MPERRTTPRKKFSYYMRVVDDDTQETLGHMVEVSEQGVQLDTMAALPINKDYYLRVELTPELADLPFIVFLARTKWSNVGNIPNLFHTGFQIIEILPEDRDVFLSIVKKYSS